MGQSISNELIPAPSSKLSKDGSCRDRARSAIVGAFVADAATMPLHWIYDQTVLERMTKQRLSGTSHGPEFFSPSSSPFYDYEVGKLSPYGDEVMPLLQCVSSRGYFDADDVRTEMYKFCISYKGRLNRVSQKFMELHELGLPWSDCAVADDTQFLAIMKVPMIVARYAGSSMMLDKLDAAVRIHQTNEKVIAAARLSARLLEKVVLGMKIPDALRWARQCETLNADEREYLTSFDAGFGGSGPGNNLPFSAAAETMGLSGQLPGSLKASLYGLKCFRGYEVAIRANIVAAGDNVCRGWLIGSMLCAEQGDNAIPRSWKRQTHNFVQIYQMADRLAGSNAHFDSDRERTCRVPMPGFL